MKFKKILNGFLALLAACTILLVSDLSNRNNHLKEKVEFEKTEGWQAQPGRTYKVGVTYITPDPVIDITLEALWTGLEDFGFYRDSNLLITEQHANGEMANLQPLHFNMDNLDLDLIVVTTTPGIAAAVNAVKKHPMVFTLSYTPLEAGAGKSYTDHLPNITGVGSFPPVEKTIEFIQETIPGVKTIGTVYNSSEANSVKVMEVGRDFMASQNIKLIESTVISTSEVYQAIVSICSRKVDAVWITGDNTCIAAIQTIVKVCHDYEMPLIINDAEYVKYGALACVGVSWTKTGTHTAPFVARVLNGESPANIPIENYVEETIELNHEVAQKLNITFPEKYLHPKSAILTDKKYKFALLHYVDSPNSEQAEDGLRHQLESFGMKEDEHFTLKTYNAQGDISTLNSIVDGVSAENWDMIFTTSTPTIQAVSKKITDTKIVFTNVGDPVKAGMGESFEKHLPNMTGISTSSDFEGLVELLLDAIPGAKRIGTLYTPAEVNSVAYHDRLKEAAEARGLKLVALPANSATELADAALALANNNIDAFTQISDNLSASGGASIIKVANNSGIPYFGFITKHAEQGAVACVARDYYYAGVDAANMARAILEGTSPEEIPFRYVTKSMVTVNEEAAKKFNIKIPEKYLKQ